MKDMFRKIRNYWQRYTPLIRVNVFNDHILHNYNYAKKLVGSGVDVVPVLKSNAYGHGLLEVANIIKTSQPRFIVVDSFFEAQVLRNNGIKTPLLIIGFSSLDNIVNCRLGEASYLIADLQWFKSVVDKINKPTRFHLKVDTGMNRQGIELEQLDELIDLVKSNRSICLEGVCSHLCDADGIDSSFTLLQIEKWNKLVQKAKIVLPDLKYCHLGASTSLPYKADIDANMIRLGIGLYGVDVSRDQKLNLKPAMQVETSITSLRTVRKGEMVGYGCTYVAKKDVKIATIPMGYFEGIDRRLSNKGFVKVGDVFCPIVGRVSMNITSIDVTGVGGVKIGDEVEVLSIDRNDKNSVEAMAKLAGTIPYVIMSRIERRLRRCVR